MSKISATMIGRWVPAGVFPLAITFATSSTYRSGWCSLYFWSNCRGFFPSYRGRRGGLLEESFTSRSNSSGEWVRKNTVYEGESDSVMGVGHLDSHPRDSICS